MRCGVSASPLRSEQSGLRAVVPLAFRRGSLSVLWRNWADSAGCPLSFGERTLMILRPHTAATHACPLLVSGTSPCWRCLATFATGAAEQSVPQRWLCCPDLRTYSTFEFRRNSYDANVCTMVPLIVLTCFFFGRQTYVDSCHLSLATWLNQLFFHSIGSRVSPVGYSPQNR